MCGVWEGLSFGGLAAIMAIKPCRWRLESLRVSFWPSIFLNDIGRSFTSGLSLSLMAWSCSELSWSLQINHYMRILLYSYKPHQIKTARKNQTKQSFLSGSVMNLFRVGIICFSRSLTLKRASGSCIVLQHCAWQNRPEKQCTDFYLFLCYLWAEIRFFGFACMRTEFVLNHKDKSFIFIIGD